MRLYHVPWVCPWGFLSPNSFNLPTFQADMGFLCGSAGKESACQLRRLGCDPWVRKIPWRRKWQPTPVCLPGKSHGQRSLEGCGPWGPERVRQDLAIKTTTTTTDILNFTLLVSSFIGTGSNNFPATLPKGAITCING